MNVLVIAVQFPFPPRSGSTTRVYQLVRQMAARNDVTVLSYARSGDRSGVEALARELPVRVAERPRQPQWAKRAAQVRSVASQRPFSSREVHTKAMQHAIDELCANTRFDVVQLESSLLCEFDFPPGPSIVVDEHNIEYEVFKRMCEGERSLARRWFNRVEYARFRRFEQRAWQQVDGCVVTSAREEPVVRAIAPDTPIAVVPNGVDVEYFAPGGDAEPRTLVFNGTLEYRPNVDAAHHLVEDIWPLVVSKCPDARLAIVGRAPAGEIRRLKRPGVVLTGEVPDVRPYLHRAAVVAVPVRMGGGTRLKVVEGLAMGKPIVSTSLGCEGIAVRDGEHLLIADGAQTFASKVVELFGDSSLQRQLSAAGRGLAEREHAWPLAGDQLQALYERVVATGAWQRTSGLRGLSHRPARRLV